MKKGEKFCGNHLEPEFFPIAYDFCPYCGHDLEVVPELKKKWKELTSGEPTTKS